MLQTLKKKKRKDEENLENLLQNIIEDKNLVRIPQNSKVIKLNKKIQVV